MLNKLFSFFNRSKTTHPFPIYGDDTFIVSYPKSGNTWVRFLIGNYITNNNFDFLNSNSFIPDMHAHPDECIKLKRPRIIKTHNTHDKSYANVIYIVRDGRDVAVSYYYYHLKYGLIEKNSSFEHFLELFNAGEIPFGLWKDHVTNWINHSPKRFLLVKYEDLIENTEKELIRMLDFLKLEIKESKVKDAVKASDFMNMANLEQKQRMQLPRNSKSDPSISFIRNGQAGDYKEYFNSDMVDKFDTINKNIMIELGYLKK